MAGRHPLSVRQTDPSGGQRGTQLPVRKKRDVAVQRVQACDQPVYPNANISRHFAAGTAIAPRIPFWMRLPDVLGEQSFVVAEIPFRQIRLNFTGFSEAGQLAGLSCSQARADQNVRKRNVRQSWQQSAGFGLAVGGQCNVGAPCVLSGERPGSLTVSNEVDSQGSHGVSAPAPEKRLAVRFDLKIVHDLCDTRHRTGQ